MKNYIITIARSYGSGGKRIGKQLAKELEIPYHGRELSEFLLDSDPSVLDAMDETLDYSLKTSGRHSLTDDPVFVSDDKLFEHQSNVIRTLAEKESCVIVGRCADYVLRDFENVIRIYLYAPLRYCMKSVMDLYSLYPDDAKQLIASMNKSRDDYYKYYTDQSRDNASNYDLCLNTGVLGFEKTIQMIINYKTLWTV